MKSIRSYNNQRGFALVTSIMMLLAATVLGVMMMNSSETELLLSGALQRYEENFNIIEGAVTGESAAVGTSTPIETVVDGVTISRDYTVEDPATHHQILSPTDSTQKVFNPYGDAPLTTGTEGAWPMDNLLRSGLSSDNQFDYHYQTTFVGAGSVIPKGYGAGSVGSYEFIIRTNRINTLEVGGHKIGTKLTSF